MILFQCKITRFIYETDTFTSLQNGLCTKKGSKYDIIFVLDRKLSTERQSLGMIMNSSKHSKQLSMKCPCKNVK